MIEAAHEYVLEWKSSGDASGSHYATWCRFHNAHWDGLRRAAHAVLPLTPVFIHVLGTIIRAAGYRATKNRLSAARERHLDSGAQWSPTVDLASRRFLNSTQRGAGPQRQSEPLNFNLLLLMAFGWMPLVTGGPVNAMDVLVLFTMSLLRENNGALVQTGHIHLIRPDRQLVWELPVSKTGPQARGCTRSWGCICLQPECPATEYPLPHDAPSFGRVACALWGGGRPPFLSFVRDLEGRHVKE